MKRYFIILIILTIFSCKDDSIVEPDISNYGYDSWPGKSGIIKTDIEFPAQLITKYQLSLTVGSNGQSFFYKIPIDENDTIKKGRLQVGVFPNIEAAQLALINYLDEMATPNKPPRLTNEDFNVGDVAFGKIYDGILKIEFVRNNVLVIVHAPTNSCKSIALTLDETIQKAPVWQVGTSIPSFILPF